MRLPSLMTSSPQRDAPPISACAFTPRTMSALARAGADRRLHVHLFRAIQRRVQMAFQAADQIGGDEAQHAGFRRLDDEVAEARNGHAARAALVHHGGDAGPHAHHVGVQAEAAGHVLIDMRVGVDHAGDDDLARDVDHLRAPSSRGTIASIAAMPAVGDADIGDAVAARGRIDHPSAAQQQVELCCPSRSPCALSEHAVSSVC